MGLLGCNISGDNAPPTSTANPITIQVETQTPAPPSIPVTDVSEMFAEWCFAAAEAATGQRMVIQDEAGLNTLYDFADRHCEIPVPRPTFDFETQVLVVVVDGVRACRAEHLPTSLENGRLVLQFVHEGTCPYDLVALYAGTLMRSAGEIEVIVNGA